jgi:hypothetical protein
VILTTFEHFTPFPLLIGVRRGVCKGVDGGRKAVSGLACPQGMEGLGMAGPSDILGSQWPPLAIRHVTVVGNTSLTHSTNI